MIKSCFGMRGFDVLIQACRKHGSPEPLLRYKILGFWVEFVGRNVKKLPRKVLNK